MKERLLQLKQEILDNLGKAKDLSVLRNLETKYLGRKGELTKILRGISSMAGEEKKNIGKLANEIKTELRNKFEQVERSLSGSADKAGFLDVTLPGKKIKQGHLHPITIIQNELEDLFTSMGFMVLDGPELEAIIIILKH